MKKYELQKFLKQQNVKKENLNQQINRKDINVINLDESESKIDQFDNNNLNNIEINENIVCNRKKRVDIEKLL